MTPGSQHPQKRCFARDWCKKVPDASECSMCSNPVDCKCRPGGYNPGVINDKEKIKILEANIRKKDNDIAVLTDMISSHPAASEQEILDELREIVVQLYDNGFKNPLATFDNARQILRKHRQPPGGKPE